MDVTAPQLRWIEDVSHDSAHVLVSDVLPPARQYVEPMTYRQARSYPDSVLWLDSVNTEMASLIEKDVLMMGALPEGVHALPTKFVFKRKLLNSGKVDKYKTRLVARGFKQIFGVDHGETFAPVLQIVSLRCLLVISLRLQLEVTHIDV